MSRLEQARDAIQGAEHMNDPRNPPNAAGQIAVAYATLAVAEELGRLNETLDHMIGGDGASLRIEAVR